MAFRQENDTQEKLTGPQKAASFLLALPTQHVQLIFDKLEGAEITTLSQIMASLGKVDSDTVEKVFSDFMENVASPGNLVGSVYSTEKLLIEVLGENRAKSILAEIRGPHGRTIWDRLCNVNVDVLVNFLKNEHPQTIAIILTQLKPSLVATILPTLPRSVAMDIIMRMLNMESVPNTVIKDVESTLKKEFTNTAVLSRTKDPYQSLAEIFNSFERSTEAAFMTELEEKNGEAATRIKSLMFTFDDLIKIDAFGIQKVVRAIDSSRLVIALRGADEKMKQHFFSGMSERAAKIMKEDMEDMRPVRLKEVEEVQAEIVRAAKNLIDLGEIVVQEEESTEQYI